MSEYVLPCGHGSRYIVGGDVKRCSECEYIETLRRRVRPENIEPKGVVSAQLLARYLRVPARWLCAEAAAGRLPAVKAGTTCLFDCETVVGALQDRAKSPLPAPAGEAGR